MPGCIDTSDSARFRTTLVLAPFEKTLFNREVESDGDKHSFQTYVRERVLSDNSLTDDFFETFEPPKKSIKIDTSRTESISESDISSTENNELRKINMELYQHALSSILEDRINETKA